MRTTDPEPRPMGPLGEKVARPAPAPATRDKAVSGAASGIVQGVDGRLRTTTHEHSPKGAR
jgi:hypothetical protein